MAKKQVCIIGGGAAGASLLWVLSQDAATRAEWEITVIHDQDKMGGHSRTLMVPGKNGKSFPVDIGVQFISPMMYPNVNVMLQRSEFKSIVPMRDYDSLRISAAFPRLNNQLMNWGNFSDYQPGSNNPNSNAFAMYTADVLEDIQTFQDFIEISVTRAEWRIMKISDYFTEFKGMYNDPAYFINYILSPYLSIINGYGNALMDDTTFMDLFPLFSKLPLPKSWNFPTPLGSFSQAGTGWQRFAGGAQTWVEAMTKVAVTFAPCTFRLNASVKAVWLSQPGGQVNVQWQDQASGQTKTDVFDKIIFTTDMWTNSNILNNANNQSLWSSLYERFIGYPRDYNMNPLGTPVVWDLLWGKCYIHTDSSMLSPDLISPNNLLQDETLQFTAYYAPDPSFKPDPKNPGASNYILANTYTTYIQKNVFGNPDPDPDADGIYLTMYGYIPDDANQKVPDPKKVLLSLPWTHGRWVPSAMGGPKTKLHFAQGIGFGGAVTYPGQQDTNIYFAGNNTTFDAEEGALISSMAMANYAFGVEYPLATVKPLGDSLFAFFLYNVYNNIMFPTQQNANALDAAHKTLPNHRYLNALKVFLEDLIASDAGTIGTAAMAVVAPKPASAKTKKVTKPSKKKSTAKKAKPVKKKTVKKTKPIKKKLVKKSAKKTAKPIKKKSVTKRKKPVKRKVRKTVRKSTAKRKKRISKKK